MGMIEVYFLGLFTLFLILTLTVLTYIYIKRYAILEDFTAYILDYIANTEDNQKLIYQIGGILGSGVKGGIGLDLPVKQRGGRFKWQDLALEFATQFLTKGLQTPSPSPTPLPQPQGQGIKTQDLTDKW